MGGDEVIGCRADFAVARVARGCHDVAQLTVVSRNLTEHMGQHNIHTHTQSRAHSQLRIVVLELLRRYQSLVDKHSHPVQVVLTVRNTRSK